MVGIGADHGGLSMKQAILRAFPEVDFHDFGTFTTDSVDYPDVAFQVAEEVAKGSCEKGILICRSGNGMAMAANKVKGIRAALCWNAKMAEMAKRHEDANILALGADYITEEEAIATVRAWLNNRFDGERHQRRIDKIKEYETKEN